MIATASPSSLPDGHQPAAGLIHHRDRGGRYASLAVEHRLQDAGIVASRGGIGSCYDNAVVEAFFASLNVGLLHRQVWPTRAAARLSIFDSRDLAQPAPPPLDSGLYDSY